MFHAIEILKSAMKENRELVFDLSEEGDPVGSERAVIIAEDCRKALELLEATTPNNQTDAVS